MGWITWDSRQAAWARAAMTSSNLATALAGNLAQTVGVFDLSLRASQRAFRSPTFGPGDFAAQRQMLFDGAIEPRHLGSVFITRSDGEVVRDAKFAQPSWSNVADRSYFKAHAGNADAGLFVSQPYVSMLSGQYSLALSRRLGNADGSFAGIVVGTIRFSYFTGMLSRLDIGPGGAIRIFETDGTMVTGTDLPEDQIGRSFIEAQLFQRLAKGRDEPFEAAAQIDGIRKLFAFKRVAGTPFIVSVNLPLTTVYADWNRKSLVTCGVSAALFTVAFLMLRAVRRQSERSHGVERQMLRSMGLFGAFYENAADALFVVRVGDGELRYESINPACECLTGLDAAKIKGRTLAETFPAEMAASVERRYRTCIESGKSYSYAEKRELPAGPRHWHTILAPVRDGAGRVVLLVGSSRDVTEANRLIAEHTQATKMEAVGRLTGGIAHDFNNGLQEIIASLELLEDDCAAASSDSAEIWHGAMAAASDNAKLVRQLLAFSRQQVLRPERVNLASALARMRRDVGPSVGTGIRVKTVVEPFTGDATVDPAQLESCVASLVLNAQDAMPEGGRIVLHARDALATDERFGQLDAGAYVVVAVQDTGPGIDEDAISRAFDPFFTTKQFGTGAGLGLSMVQGVCRQSGGDARILRHPAGGTRVELWLPRARADEAGMAEQSTTNHLRFGMATGRILLADDGRELAQAVAPVLVAAGFEVVTAASGTDGLLRMSDRNPYDLVVAGPAMPDMSLREFTVRLSSARPGMPLVMVVRGDALPEGHRLHSNVMLLEAGASDEAILELVRSAIAARGQANRPAAA